MTLALITVLYKSESAVRCLMRCLQAQNFCDWHLYAIDNACGDGAASFLVDQADDRVSVVRNERNEGFARAVNVGLRVAVNDGADRYILINPDVRFEADFLTQLMSIWTDQDVIAPRIMQDGTADGVWYAGGTFDRAWAFMNTHGKDAEAPSRVVEFATGCCLGLTHKALRRVGLLDESFFVYWEDTDLCLRLSEASVQIAYVREPPLWHEGGGSSGGEHGPAARRLYYQSYAVFLRKHFGWQHALKTMARVTVKEGGLHGHRQAARIVLAMGRGMVAPLLPVPRLIEDRVASAATTACSAE